MWGDTSVVIAGKLAEVSKLIENAVTLGLPVSETWLSQQIRYQDILATISDRVGQFGAKAGDFVARSQANAIATGIAHAGQSTAATGVAAGLRTISPAVAEAALAAFGTQSPVAAIFQQMGVGAVGVARRAFTRGLSQGQNPRVIARTLIQEIEGLGKVRALRIASEETHRAYRVASRETFRANQDVLSGLRYASARDGRVCPICLARDGTILGIDDPDPRHIGCRCVLIPIAKFFDSTVREDGEAWLRKQPTEEQKRRLGPARYELWSSGKMRLQDIYEVQENELWGPSLKFKTLTKLRAA